MLIFKSPLWSSGLCYGSPASSTHLPRVGGKDAHQQSPRATSSELCCAGHKARPVPLGPGVRFLLPKRLARSVDRGLSGLDVMLKESQNSHLSDGSGTEGYLVRSLTLQSQRNHVALEKVT